MSNTNQDRQDLELELSSVYNYDELDSAMSHQYPQLGSQFACVDADPDRNEADSCTTCGTYIFVLPHVCNETTLIIKQINERSEPRVSKAEREYYGF